MGQILKPDGGVRRDTSLWPVDKLVLAYFAFMAALMLLWWGSVPHAGLLLLWHVAGSVLLIYEIKRPNPTTWLFRNWYPVIYVASCYKEMADFLPLARHVTLRPAVGGSRSANLGPSTRSLVEPDSDPRLH